MIEDVVFDYLELLTIIGISKACDMKMKNKKLVNDVSKYSIFGFVGYKTFEYIKDIYYEFSIDDMF